MMKQRGIGIVRRVLIVVLLSVSPVCVRPAAGAETDPNANLFDMSINQLMDVQIDAPASITETDPLKTPASVTVITADDIARTPARNVLDLIEIYVPGALWMNHSVGPLPGIRGVLVDRPYKFLVNVNGVNVNIKAHYGARLELLNWDLNDIARIEIIRGPGSVTYGPGAIGGVINIHTKNARQAKGLEVGGSYWGKYDSIGNHVGYGQTGENADAYGYLSVVHTDGASADIFGVNSTRAGYLGHSGAPSYPNPATDYMTDYDEEPQIKAHVDVRLGDYWRVWTRYGTSSSEVMQGTAVQYRIDGEYENFRQSRYRYVQLAAENRLPLDEAFELRTLMGASSTDVHDIQKYTGSIDNDRDNLGNIGWIWSENEYFIRPMLHYDPEDGWFKAAAGAEISYDTIRPAWGKDEDDGLRLSEGIISGPSSEVYGTGYRQVTSSSSTYFPIGEGWETWSHAFLGELNFEVAPQSTLLLSARLDKHVYTDYMFSPRAAWIQELKQDHYLKFIAQRSVRMNTQEELYMNHELGEDNDPEKLDSLEAIYSGKLTSNLSVQGSVFYNWNDVIAWDSVQRRSAPVGSLQTLGLEGEAEYRIDDWRLGISHAYTKLNCWDLDKDLTTSGISYTDYDGVLTSSGNDLNNWPNHATKLFANLDLLDRRLLLHGDLRLFWGFEGAEDGLHGLEEAGGNSEQIRKIRHQSAYEAQMSANFSIGYKLTKYAMLSLFVHNIPVFGDNKRYAYSSGYKNTYPDKTSWVEEPTVVGISYRLNF